MRDALPSRLSPARTGPYASLDKSMARMGYKGRANHAHDFGTALADQPAPRDCTIYYFEATFSSTSDADDDAMRGDDGEISLAAGIGLVMPSFPLDRCPGNSPGSVGYRGDGRVLHNEETCKERLSSMSNGSTAGCGLISSTSEVFFTLNGENLGVVCQVSKVGPLYPAIAVHGIGESATVNFGEHAFLFDLDSLIVGERRKECEALSTIHVDESLMQRLVEDYLLVQGCDQTLCALQKACRGKEASSQSQAEMMDVDPPSQPVVALNPCEGSQPPSQNIYDTMTSNSDAAGLKQSTPFRSAVRVALLSGDASGALDLLWKSQKTMLEVRADIRFALEAQVFIEMVRQGEVLSAVKYARETLAPYGDVVATPASGCDEDSTSVRSPPLSRKRACSGADMCETGYSATRCSTFVDQVTQVMGLLAYPPSTVNSSPLAHLISLRRRQHVADCVNGALIQHSLPNSVLGTDDEVGGRSALHHVAAQLLAAAEALREEVGRGEEFDLNLACCAE